MGREGTERTLRPWPRNRLHRQRHDTEPAAGQPQSDWSHSAAQESGSSDGSAELENRPHRGFLPSPRGCPCSACARGNRCEATGSGEMCPWCRRPTRPNCETREGPHAAQGDVETVPAADGTPRTGLDTVAGEPGLQRKASRTTWNRVAKRGARARSRPLRCRTDRQASCNRCSSRPFRCVLSTPASGRTGSVAAPRAEPLR